MKITPEFYLEDLKSKFGKIKFEEYYLSYSGGRDSHFLYWFIKEVLHDEKIKIISVNTLMEHPEIKQRMINNADTILLPIKKHKDIKTQYGIPCFTKFQDDHISRYQNGSRSQSTMNMINGTKKSMYNMSKKPRELLLAGKLHKISPMCCKYLKKEPLHKFEKKSKLKPIIGVRSSESIMRKKNSSCFRKNRDFTPIHDLTDELLREIEIMYNIPIPKIYGDLQRTGCMGCPYGHNIEKELLLLTNAQRNFVYDYFKESYKVKGISKEVQKNLCDNYG